MSSTVLPQVKSPQPSNLILKERESIDFDVDLMHDFLEGTHEEGSKTLEIMQQLERDPILNTDTTYYEKDKSQHREITAKKIARLAQYIEIDAPNFDIFQHRLNLMAIVDPQLGTRIGVHLGLFLSSIRGNGTEEQFDYWAFKRGAIYMKDIYGCFAMTELAHGSNVAGLETTATFNKSTNKILINTPHLGATKWWIGGAAHSATHTVCYARLIVDNKDYGVKTFVVPLRDSNHQLYPGISIGDIGAKMGRDGIDNGWIQFSNVEIPKEYMLTKYTKIDEDGEVIEPPLAQLAYGALLGGRVTMVTDSFRMSERFTTIALRYAVGRRQFANKNAKEENQLINYPLHQRRLIPFLASTYAMSLASYEIQNFYKETLEEVDSSVKSQDFEKLGKSIDKLKLLFANSASLKSTCTWLTAELIDECRQACGGHGYSSYSGFGKAYNDWVVQCTWEGDNNILATSAGRIIIQNSQKVLNKKSKLNGDFKFIEEIINSDSNNKKPILSNGKLTDLNLLLKSYSTLIVRISLGCIDKLSKNGNNWDLISTERVVLSKLYAIRFMLNKWILKMNNLSNNDSGNISKYLNLLAQVFALVNIDKFSGYFLQYEVLAINSLFEVQSELSNVLEKIRPQVIGLTDSFKFSDFFINSSLGFYNGDIYNNYFGIVRKQNDASITKAPYSNEFENLLNRSSVEDREKNQKTEDVLKILRK